MVQFGELQTFKVNGKRKDRQDKESLIDRFKAWNSKFNDGADIDEVTGDIIDNSADLPQSTSGTGVTGISAPSQTSDEFIGPRQVAVENGENTLLNAASRQQFQSDPAIGNGDVGTGGLASRLKAGGMPLIQDADMSPEAINKLLSDRAQTTGFEGITGLFDGIDGAAFGQTLRDMGNLAVDNFGRPIGRMLGLGGVGLLDQNSNEPNFYDEARTQKGWPTGPYEADGQPNLLSGQSDYRGRGAQSSSINFAGPEYDPRTPEYAEGGPARVPNDINQGQPSPNRTIRGLPQGPYFSSAPDSAQSNQFTRRIADGQDGGPQRAQNPITLAQENQQLTSEQLMQNILEMDKSYQGYVPSMQDLVAGQSQQVDPVYIDRNRRPATQIRR